MFVCWKLSTAFILPGDRPLQSLPSLLGSLQGLDDPSLPDVHELRSLLEYQEGPAFLAHRWARLAQQHPETHTWSLLSPNFEIETLIRIFLISKVVIFLHKFNFRGAFTEFIGRKNGFNRMSDKKSIFRILHDDYPFKLLQCLFILQLYSMNSATWLSA